jgi:hypothetical protein
MVMKVSGLSTLLRKNYVGLASFPAPEHVLNVMTKEHCELREAFVKLSHKKKQCYLMSKRCMDSTTPLM